MHTLGLEICGHSPRYTGLGFNNIDKDLLLIDQSCRGGRQSAKGGKCAECQMSECPETMESYTGGKQIWALEHNLDKARHSHP